jgi:uncharacterized membrane protein HdeD (DUF308 family)
MTTTAAREKLPPLIPEDVDLKPAWKKYVLLGVGILLIVVGIIFVPVPVMSGVPFWVVGALVLGVSVPPFARFVNRQEARLPARWRRKLRPRLWRKARDKLKEQSG